MPYTAKTDKFTTLEVVAIIFASFEHRNKLANELNPGNGDAARAKPSEKLYVSVPAPKGDWTEGTNDSVYLPSLTSYTKMTLGVNPQYLDDNTEAMTVTDKHREAAQLGMDTIKSKIMLMVLKGRTINGFHAALSALMDKSSVGLSDIGLLSYVPKTSLEFAENSKIEEKKTEFMASKPLGEAGDRIAATVTVFNVRQMGE